MTTINVTQQSVSVVVDREVLPGKKEEFENVLRGIIDACKTFPGYLGTDVHLPQIKGGMHYRIVFRFATLDELKNWEHSPVRQEWVQKIDKLIKEPTKLQIISGLETWFALPRCNAIIPPKRYKMAIVTWLAITPLLIAFNLATQPLLGNLPLVLRILVTTPIIVILMTYVVMPYMAKLFAKWMYPPST